MGKIRRRSLFQTRIKMKANGNPNNADKSLQKQNLQLKEQNSQLAKELEEHKAIIIDLTKERDQAKLDLIGEKAITVKIMEFINDIQVSAQTNLTNLVSSSNCVTDILKLTHTLSTFHKSDRKSICAPCTDITVTAIPSSTSHDIVRPKSSVVNEITTKTKRPPQFTTLNPLSFLLNLKSNDADDELPVPKHFRLSEYHRDDVDIESGEGNEPNGGCRNEFDDNNRLDKIAVEGQTTDASILEQSKDHPRGSLPSDAHMTNNFNIEQKCLNKSSRAENSIQRRSNSLSEEDQIELIDDNEIINPNLPLLSSTIISSSPVQITEFRHTRSFQKRRMSIARNQAAETEILNASKTSTSDTLRLDSSNPIISKFEALKSYNLVAINNFSSTNPEPPATMDKNEFVIKPTVKEGKRRRRTTELEDIIAGLNNPIIWRAISSYRRSNKRMLQGPQEKRRNIRELRSDAHTPLQLRSKQNPKTESLYKEADLRK